ARGQGKEPMSTNVFRASLALLAGLALTPMGRSQNCDCEQGCCPPCIKYHYEGPPRLKFKHGCPRPICDPCQLPHFGYYQTCWSPWPFPPDWTHCPVQPPAALVPAIPPKRFRGEPPRDEEKKDETAPKPSQLPQEEASHKNSQWLPPASTQGA